MLTTDDKGVIARIINNRHLVLLYAKLQALEDQTDFPGQAEAIAVTKAQIYHFGRAIAHEARLRDAAEGEGPAAG